MVPFYGDKLAKLKGFGGVQKSLSETSRHEVGKLTSEGSRSS